VTATKNHWGWYETDAGTVYYPMPSGRQALYFEDIASIPDPCERFAAEEAKRQEILTWPGVKYAEYNSLGTVD
jgi:phage-related protein